MKNIVTIYSLTDPRDSLIKYVGKTTNKKRRYTEHLKEIGNYKKVRWINHLKSLGLKPIMHDLDIVERTEEDFWEIYWIAQIKSWGFKLLNHTNGGGNPPIVRKFGEENSFRKEGVKEKILEMNLSRKGKTFDELYGRERAQKLRNQKKKRFTGKNNPMFNKHQTESAKTKIGIANSGENNWMYGKMPSEKHLNLFIQMAKTPKTFSHRKKLSEIAFLRLPMSEDTKQKIRIASTKENNGNFKGVVYQYDKKYKLIKQWNAWYEIKSVYGNKSSNISSCLTGKLKTAYGFIWSRQEIK